MFFKKNIILISPFLLIIINFIVAIVFGKIIGKWAFIPVILLEWCFFIVMIRFFSSKNSISKWLKKPLKFSGWSILSVIIGLMPLPLFLMHWNLLSVWTIWLPWILIAFINPWMEEFYWRGLLLDKVNDWPNWKGVVFTSLLFAVNHIVFSINSELNRGFTVVISTFIMGIIWAIAYKKTNNLRWIIFGHFLVDFLNISSVSFLDLYK